MLGVILDILPFLLPMQYGLASQYDWPRDPLSGKSLACQYQFKPDAFKEARKQGCAHRFLPCGTRLLISNPRTGRSQVCTVVDRGPYGATYRGKWVVKIRKTDPGEWRGIIDLSMPVADRLGLNGLEPVFMQLLSLPR